MNQPARSVLVVTNLYPSPAFPAMGPFVRDQVQELGRRHRLAVVSPLKISPLNLRTARRVLAVPRCTTDDGVPVCRVVFPDFPIGGITLEPRLWATRLSPLLRQVYREIDADLVHAHYAFPDGYAASRFTARNALPLVLSLWGSDLLRTDWSRRARRVLQRTFVEARGIIAVSQELAERAEAVGAAPERLTVLPGGVPYREPLDRTEVRARLGLGDKTRCLLAVGFLIRRKQPLDMLQALLELRADGERDLLLVFIGDGPERSRVEEFVQRHRLYDNVRLLGHQPRDVVWEWQSAVDLIVNSSSVEGTPFAVVEALGAGTPVAAYPLPGIRDALEAVGGGRVSEASTPEALAAAICAELGSARNRHALAQAARERFDIERICDAIEAVYEAVLR